MKKALIGWLIQAMLSFFPVWAMEEASLAQPELDHMQSAISTIEEHNRRFAEQNPRLQEKINNFSHSSLNKQDSPSSPEDSSSSFDESQFSETEDDSQSTSSSNSPEADHHEGLPSASLQRGKKQVLNAFRQKKQQREEQTTIRQFKTSYPCWIKAAVGIPTIMGLVYIIYRYVKWVKNKEKHTKKGCHGF